jgi:hypothetical protein
VKQRDAKERLERQCFCPKEGDLSEKYLLI